MYAFIVDELMFATAQAIREQARRARPHVARRPARPARLRSRRSLVAAGRSADAVETKTHGCGGCR